MSEPVTPKVQVRKAAASHRLNLSSPGVDRSYHEVANGPDGPDGPVATGAVITWPPHDISLPAA